MDGPEKAQDPVRANPPREPAVSSPYSTGGGGVTFERRVATAYLAALLNGDTAVGLDGRRLTQVAFQQAPGEPVDDLVLLARGDGDGVPSLTVAVGVRRHPLITPSDHDTQKLLTDYLRSLHQTEHAGVHQEYFLVVAGPQPHAGQVASLATLARTSTEEAYFPLVEKAGRFDQSVRNRLGPLVALVATGLASLNLPHAEADARSATWKLLSRLTVLQPRYETPDLTDWEQLINVLRERSRDRTLDGARGLRDRLEVLAGTYAPQAATVDQMSLLRDVHQKISTELTRFHSSWSALASQEQVGRAAVRSTIGQTPDDDGVHLERTEVRDALRALIRNDTTIVISGESGAGKSALVLEAIDTEKAEDPDHFDAVYLNLRQLPDSGSTFDAALGAPFVDLLRVMNTPSRTLIIDGADYLAEADSTSFAWLVHAALAAEVKLVVVATIETAGAVKAELDAATHVAEFQVPPLEDTQLETVVANHTALRGLLSTQRSKDLLRRPVIADLLARAGITIAATSEIDAMARVWKSLIRRNEQSDRGAPDARDRVLKLLAQHSLGRITDDELLPLLDFSIVSTLRRDGLLAPASPAPWQRVPEFFHEQLRLYAVSQVLLSHADPVAELITASAPRWALPAARLAAQFLLASEDSSMNPLAGRFERVQAQFDRLPVAGFGERWTDLPTEAALPLDNSRELLSSAWSGLVANNAAALSRVFRVVQQRHITEGIVDASVAEPIVSALLANGWPRESNKRVEQLIRDWLRALILSDAEPGHEIRVELRERIAARVANADAGAEAAAQAARDALAARTPEEVAEDEARGRRIPVSSGSIGFSRRRRRGERPPMELTNDTVVEQLALLGKDLAQEGEALLRRLAEESPTDLQPALEEPLGGRSLATYSPSLLVELADAYYIDDVHPEDDDFGWGFREKGVRDHSHSVGMPFSSAYRGPFLPMLQADFPGGVAFIARLLNHAALCRVRGFRATSGSSDPVADNSVSLSITGEPRRYVGDSNVWLWYRGGGTGPYPCLSALQALDLVADQMITAGVPIGHLVEMLMADCENLATPALVVGMLVRHLESAGTLLDPYLAEPEIWQVETGRVVQESSGFLGKSEPVYAPEKRSWLFRQVAMVLALSAEPAREAELENIAVLLEERARVQCNLGPDDVPDEGVARYLASVSGWASSLRRSSFLITHTEDGMVIEGTVPDAVNEILKPAQAQGQRMSDAYGLANRYDYARHSLSGPPAIDLIELHNDVETAKALLATEELDGQVIAEACSALACSVIERRFIKKDPVDETDLLWATELLLDVASAFADQTEHEVYDFSYFSHTPDIPACRAVALLLLPEASQLWEMLDRGKGEPLEQITAANRWAATCGSLDGRLIWSRSLDHLWRANPIELSGGETSHTLAYSLVEESIRGAILGPWDDDGQTRAAGRLVGPLTQALADADADDLVAERLIPGIRGLQQLAIGNNSLSDEGLQLLVALLATYSAIRQQEEHSPQHSQTDMLAIARALLILYGHGKDEFIHRQLEAFIDRNDLLDEFMDAIAAAGEENRQAATAAAGVWPQLMTQAIGLMGLGHVPVGDGSLAARGVASLIPNIANDNGYLLRELDIAPIAWIEFDTIAPHVDQWVPFAAGHGESVDQLVSLLRLTSIEQQVNRGAPWIEELVRANPPAIAGRSYLLPGWLREIRSPVRGRLQSQNWQRIVDLLVVAGEERIADMVD